MSSPKSRASATRSELTCLRAASAPSLRRPALMLVLVAAVLALALAFPTGGGSSPSAVHAPRLSLRSAHAAGGRSVPGASVTVLFDTEPTTCGSITFNGITYSTGQQVSVPAGSYTVTGITCVNFGFNQWLSGGNSGITFASSGAPSTTVTVSASGTIFAQFRSPEQTTLTTQLGPTNCGSSILFAGISMGDGALLYYLTPGTYNISAIPCTGSGWSFAGWDSSGTSGWASFASASSAQTTVTIGGLPSITATYVDTSPNVLTFQPGPIGCGSIEFSGSNYTYGQTVNVASGGSYTYHIAGNPCVHFGIGNGWGYSWGVGPSASLSVASAAGNATTVTESGSGVLSMTFFSSTRESFSAATGPTSCGTLYLNGFAFTNGGSMAGGISPGHYNLTAVPCASYSFSSWNLGSAPGLWVADRASPQTLLNVTTGGTLTANFTTTTTYPVTILTGPESCGEVEISGQLYSSGVTTQLPAGTYNLQSIPCSNFGVGNGWVSWGVGPGTGLSVATGLLTVSGPGVLQAVFGSVTEYSIAVFTGPTTCGTIYVSGNGVTDGNGFPGSLPAGNYNITAVPCSSYRFSLWSVSGGISVARASSSSTTMTLTGNANLGAVFIAGTPSMVTFSTTPPTCGSVIFDGGSFTNTQTVNVATGGTYSISANPCNPYQFSSWSASGGVSVASSGSNATTVTVNSNGGIQTVWTYVKPQYSVTFDTGPTTCGSITVNGTTTYTNGQSASFVPGTSYSITANPCGNAFSYWSVGGGVALGSSAGANPNTFSVTQGGYLVATFASTTVYRLFFHLAPVGCGSIVFNGVPYTDGQSVQLSPGTYGISASPCANYGFNYPGWRYIAGSGISVSGSTATLSSYSNLTAQFSSDTSYSVSAIVSPSTCGSISVGNVSLADGASVGLSPGVYHVGDIPCANFAFQGWNGTGGVAVTSPRTNPTTITVSGDGALAATDLGPSLFPVTLDSSPSGCGGVDFDLMDFPSGSVVLLSTGSYEIGPVPCGNFSFQGFNFQGQVSSGGSGGVLGTVMSVGGAGTATAVYNDPQQFPLTVDTNPGGCGGVRVGGVPLGNGASANLAVGSYNLSVATCAGYVFSGWNVSGAVSVAGPLLAATSVAVAGSGEVVATFTGSTLDTVTISTAPTTCGSVELDGRTLSNGQSVALVAGAGYSLQALACHDRYFYFWGVGSSGNLSVGGIYSNPTTLTATGSGVLGVEFQSDTADPVTFYTSPTICGSISFGGTVYTDGQTYLNAPPGSFAISPNPCAGYYFAYWSGAGGVSVASPSSPSTTATVSGTGSLWLNFTSGSVYPVTFTESGLPGGTDWSVTVNGFTITSSSATNFRSLSAGTYTYSIAGVSQGPGAQYGATPSSGTFTITTSGFTQAVVFASEVYLSVSASPAGTGTAAPTSGWYTYGTSVTLSEAPAPGYLAAGWWGNGTGNYTGPLSSTTLALYYPETEVALFSPTSINNYAVNFTESGLPAGATWSATLGGVSLASSTPWIVFQEPNGANIPWSVQSPLLPSSGTEEVASTSSGTLTVSGSPVSQFISYSTQYYMGVQAVPAGEGSVSVTSGWYTAGSTVTLSASPAPGAFFVGWAGQGAGNYTGTLDPASVTLSGPVNETAVFSTSGGTSTTYIVSFATSPASCGSITFGGTTYSNGGQDTSVPAVAYAISATPCSGEVFSGWSVSGGLTVSAPSSATTAVSVSGNGTLTANFVTGPSGGFSVQFSSNPSTCGLITFAGFSYASGSSNRSVPATSYSASASACPGYSFAGWYATGGLSLSSTTLSTTTVTVSGNGRLQANFTGPGGPGGSSVSFTTSPTGCGTISFGGRSYGSGGMNGSVPAGTYPISATPCPGYAFSGWSTSGGLSMASSSQSSTSVTVSGGGTLTASFTANSPPKNGPNTVLGVPSGTLVAVLGILVALLAVLFLVALVRGRRRSPPPGPSRARKRAERALSEPAPASPSALVAPAAAAAPPTVGTYPPPPSLAPAPSENPAPPPPSPPVPAKEFPEPPSEPPSTPAVPIASSSAESKKPFFCSECGASNDRGATACASCGAGLNG